jgi:hypothetical protein
MRRNFDRRDDASAYAGYAADYESMALETQIQIKRLESKRSLTPSDRTLLEELKTCFIRYQRQANNYRSRVGAK